MFDFPTRDILTAPQTFVYPKDLHSLNSRSVCVPRVRQTFLRVIPYQASRAESEHHVALVQQSAGVGYVHSGLLLVTGQHPHLNPCLSQ